MLCVSCSSSAKRGIEFSSLSLNSEIIYSSGSWVCTFDVDPRIPSLGDPGMHRPRWSIPSPSKIRPTIIDKNRTKLRCTDHQMEGYWPRRNDTKDANFVMNDMKLALFNFVRTLYLKPQGDQSNRPNNLIALPSRRRELKILILLVNLN